MKRVNYSNRIIRAAVLGTALFLPVFSFAAEKKVESSDSLLNNGVFLILTAVIVLLAIVIVGMTQMVKAGASLNVDRAKKEKNNISGGARMTALLALMLIGHTAFAQGDAPSDAATVIAEPPFTYWGLGNMLFISMVLFIVFEIIMIVVLYFTGISLLRTEEQERRAREAKKAAAVKKSRLLSSITDSQTPEEEEALLSDHEYDGIRELDNNLPLWWKYGFYLTIIVSVIYMFVYHVFDGPSSEEEYLTEVAEGEAEVAEYKKNNAKAVDESTVVALMDASSLGAGKNIFMQNCAACHGPNGEGLVGPNLTDAYWLHKGGVSDVFKSVKYGWPDKGMKAWEQDLKPIEIQQVTSYILSLKGTNPANAKAQEGELFADAGATPVSADTMQVDSTVKK